MQSKIADFLENEPISGLSDTNFSKLRRKDRIFKYVRHEDRSDYERDGWIFAADLGPTHGHYAVLMERPTLSSKQ